MPEPLTAAALLTISDQFVHVRMMLSILVGLSIARLLTGLARFVQHPSREQVYGPHLAWALFMLLTVIHYWWAEFNLAQIHTWSFAHYLLLIVYASLLFLISTLLFPDRMDEYNGFKDYFHARQRWFFGLLIAMLLTDLADTLLKGRDYFISLGLAYDVWLALLVSLSGAALFIASRRFHMIFAIVAVVSSMGLIFYRFDSL
ncbi:hypothetical protein [Candidatus Thiodictyon syntrophicum]|jgi:hypothetical protein|uniref:Uncharacterized protein n=1 Tax=Candidatus Thiodictyon syntrophicum TaxID=1166950 RepID=A0A2K8U7Z7_9GAMM|nr:hypothetical protein [Candidatus Thiodictyon syntrophicum]AUB81728.1 hypothetical protein THSYN_12660 [Candidatus Thiodictyon syntrophicum]